MGDHSSRERIAPFLQQPTRAVSAEICLAAEAARRPYSVLLPVGFTVPPCVAADAVRSYRTLSISPARGLSRKDWATCFLLHCPLDRSSRPLAGTVIS